MSPAVLIRPMRLDDVLVAERLSDAVFSAADAHSTPRGLPVPPGRSAERGREWVSRTSTWVTHDGPGCWVAEDDDGALAGLATSARRDGVWLLGTFAVSPHLQGMGVGRRLLDAALEHGRGCLHGMLSASDDARAVRRYHAAGFTLHPQLQLSGTVDRSAIPVIERVREGSPADRDLQDSVDRRVRGAAHGRDHDWMAASWRLLVCDTGTGDGYAYVDGRGAVQMLAATDRRTATRLLWAAIADGPPEQTIPHVTAANQWAVDVGFAARLTPRQSGFLALRGMRPPAPYLHHGVFL